MLVRGAIRQVLATINGVRIVAEAEDGPAAISCVRTHSPALLTLDGAMPGARGMEVYGEVRRWSPETRVCVVTGFVARGQLAGWIAAGVDGLLLKTCDTDEMRRGFETVLSGRRFQAGEVRRIVGTMGEGEDLTLRERQVLHLLAEGLSNTEVAARLSISAKTVDNHRTRLMAKLGVRSYGQLIAYALREGLLEPGAQITHQTP